MLSLRSCERVHMHKVGRAGEARAVGRTVGRAGGRAVELAGGRSVAGVASPVAVLETGAGTVRNRALCCPRCLRNRRAGGRVPGNRGVAGAVAVVGAVAVGVAAAGAVAATVDVEPAVQWSDSGPWPSPVARAGEGGGDQDRGAGGSGAARGGDREPQP